MLDREETPPPANAAATELKGFETYWKPILFPEINPAKKRPEGWQQEGDAWVRKNDIRWNTGYTERVFPEMLRPIRDSGDILCDWEEAVAWIYLEYGLMENLHKEPNKIILESLSRETVLFRQK
jgi:hypothetical protein